MNRWFISAALILTAVNFSLTRGLGSSQSYQVNRTRLNVLHTLDRRTITPGQEESLEITRYLEATENLLPDLERYDVRGKPLIIHYQTSDAVALRFYLANADGEVIRYIPDQAFLVRSVNIAAWQCLPEGIDWVGRYEPEFKMSPTIVDRLLSSTPSLNDGKLNIAVWLFPGSNLSAVVQYCQGSGIAVIQVSDEGPQPALITRCSEQQVIGLAKLDDVYRLDIGEPVTPANDVTKSVVQSGTAASGPTIWDNGLRGEAQIIGIMDSGVDLDNAFFYDPEHENFPGPEHRKVVGYRVDGQGAFSDECVNGHGTHLAGTIAGNADELGYSGQYNGVAPAARLSVCDIGSDCSGVLYPPASLDGALLTGLLDDAGVYLLGWYGSTNSYHIYAEQVDTFMWFHKNLLIICPVGNEGPATASVRYPGTAKNIISVGASDQDPNQHNLYQSSSRGPVVSSNRLAPMICAPGTDSAGPGITSAASDGFIDATPDYAVIGDFSGTSAATAAVGACAALARQYCVEGFYPSGSANPSHAFTPSAACLKAMLIAGAENMSGAASRPSYAQGWGRVVLDEVLYFVGDSSKLFLLDNLEGLGTGEVYSRDVQVASAEHPLKIVVCWTDRAGNLLVNDLNVRVVYQATTWFGNNFTNGWSNTNQTIDHRNPTECVFLPASGLTPGAYSIIIEGEDVPYGQENEKQPFALVVTGDIVVDALTPTPAPDYEPPFIQSRMPEAGAVTVPLDTDIEIVLRDAGSGVDPASITMTVDGAEVTPQISCEPPLCLVVYDPPEAFAENQVVTVSIDACDASANCLETATYSFTCGTPGSPTPTLIPTIAPSPTPLMDLQPPYPSDQVPAPDATGVPITTTIFVRINDALTGVDASSIAMLVNGLPATLVLTGDPEPLSYQVLYEPPVPFPCGQAVSVTLAAADLNEPPNVMTPYSYSFTCEACSPTPTPAPDSEPPYITEQNPAPEATNVPLDTAVSFHVLDDGTGVDVSSLSMLVNNQAVTPEISGEPSDYLVVYSPSQPFTSGEVVSVLIEVSDHANPPNVMPPVSYNFTCIIYTQTPTLTPTSTESPTPSPIVTPSVTPTAGLTGTPTTTPTPGPDAQPPYVTDQNPHPEQFGVSWDSPITFTIRDDGMGVDMSSISVGVQYSVVTPLISGNPNAYQVTCNPYEFPEPGLGINVYIMASDLATPPNDLDLYTYRFYLSVFSPVPSQTPTPQASGTPPASITPTISPTASPESTPEPTPTAIGGPPDAPELFAEPEFTAGTHNLIRWSEVYAQQGIEYLVQCAEDFVFVSIVADSGWINVRSYEFQDLRDSRTYYYRAKARNAAGLESDFSNIEFSTQDASKPNILAGGYWWTDVSTSTGGALSIKAYIREPHIESVMLYYAGAPTGLVLLDDGLNGDEAAGDKLFTLRILETGPGIPVDQYEFTVVVFDKAGNYAQWPTLIIE